jgi:hypothetical protein
VLARGAAACCAPPRCTGGWHELLTRFLHGVQPRTGACLSKQRSRKQPSPAQRTSSRWQPCSSGSGWCRRAAQTLSTRSASSANSAFAAGHNRQTGRYAHRVTVQARTLHTYLVQVSTMSARRCCM